MSSAIKTPAFAAKASNILNEDNSSIYSGGEWSFKNASAVTGFHITASGAVTLGPSGFTGNHVVNGDVFVTRGENSVISMGSAAGVAYTKIAATNEGAAKVGLAFSTTSDAVNSIERMRIDANGAFTFQTTQNVGFAKAFLIKNSGESGNGRNAVTLDSGNTGTNSSIFAFNKNSVNLWNLFTDTPANNSTDFAIWSSSTGGVTLGSNTATSWSPRSSDERKKKNFETTQGLNEILQIEPVKYHFKTEEDSAPKRLGFKAQNLQSIVPEMVFPTGEKAEDGSDYLTITPDYLIPVLVKAIQEQQAMIEELKAKVSALESK